jgi:DNA-binding NarL/FixJ family response regulator
MSPRGLGVTGGQPGIKVLVVDDHDLFRVGLASMLASQPEIDVVGQASSGRMGTRLAGELKPDVVLVDIRMPDMDGPEVTSAILATNPSIRVVMLTVLAGERDIADAVSAGACGYLLKDSGIGDVVAAIHAAASGNAWLSPRALRALLERMQRTEAAVQPAPDAEAQLTERELEVLQLLARGLGNNEIAAALYISPPTAKKHVSSILGKLGVSNRVQAAIYALRYGIA